MPCHSPRRQPDTVSRPRRSKPLVSAELLLGYSAATSARTAEYISGLTDSELARIVDERWDPPVSVSIRLVSVLSDDLQHAGQAAFVKGLIP